MNQHQQRVIEYLMEENRVLTIISLQLAELLLAESAAKIVLCAQEKQRQRLLSKDSYRLALRFISEDQ